MRFYLPCPPDSILDRNPGYRPLADWMEERGVPRWQGIPRDLNREGGPLTIDTATDEDAVAFKLKFGHLTIPEPPYHALYLKNKTWKAKFKRLYMSFFRGIFYLVYNFLYKVKQ